MPLERHTSRPEGLIHSGPVGRPLEGPVGRHLEGSMLPPEASYGKGRGLRFRVAPVRPDVAA